MLTKEQNDLLTQTGPGTPGGKLLRCYWQPVALSEEIPLGGAPIPVRLLSEDLVLFRDEQGRPGLLGMHCSHRAADLSYGRVEDGGLRCLYHGWLYDVHGNCLDQPGEPAGSDFKSKIRHPAYPCREAAGVVFAYMGSAEPPLLPAYHALIAPDGYYSAAKTLSACNYLQGNEGNIDPVHLSFLHQYLDERVSLNRSAPIGSQLTANTLNARDRAARIELEETDFGLRIYTLRQGGPDDTYVRITNFVYPNLSAVAGNREGGGYSLNWHVPIDDMHHWRWSINFQTSKPIDDIARRAFIAEKLPDGRLTRNKENRYLQDREELKTHTFTGMGANFVVHDTFATEGEGPIQDRSSESLGYSDKAIAAARRMLLQAIRDVEEGGEAPHVIRDQQANDLPQIGSFHEVIPNDQDWRTVWQHAPWTSGRAAFPVPAAD